MTRWLDPSDPDLSGLIRPGDTVYWTDGPGEPVTLTEALVRQRHRFPGVRLLVGNMLAGSLAPLATLPDPVFRITSFGALARTGDLAAAGRLDIVPCHYSDYARLLSDGPLRPDVVLLHASAGDGTDLHNLGAYLGPVHAALSGARTVIAEVNTQVPWIFGDGAIGAARFDAAVTSDRALAASPSRDPGPVDAAIGEHVARLVPDRATVEIGVGSVATAVARRLAATRRDLGVHSGILSDWFVDLIDSGAVTNRYKEIDPGLSVATGCLGTDRLYRHLHRNPACRLRDVRYSHSGRAMAPLERLVAINGAVEVDLSGQVNAETIGRRYIGATGGQGDFHRAALNAPLGRAIIMLPSASRDGRTSRIVPRLGGPVTTLRSEADLVVTEYGVAELRGRSLAERARALAAIAHPEHRRALLAAGEELAATT